MTLKSGEKVEGYIFDRRSGKTLADSAVRVYPKTGNQKLTVSYSDIAALAFTGKDTAAGKSWEAWMQLGKLERYSRRGMIAPEQVHLLTDRIVQDDIRAKAKGRR